MPEKEPVICTPMSMRISLNSAESNVINSISSARKAFHCVTDLPCREKELEQLELFIHQHINSESSGSMYISGLPGTGKTASLNYVIQQEKIQKNYNIVFINCTAVKSSGAVYLRICEQLKIKTAAKTEKGALAAVEKYLSKKHKMVLLILDEIDQLESKFQSVLYSIFEWPSRKKARIVLIGIANAVDLTDRVLPRLYADVKSQPILLHFSPYTKEQIATILKHRLKQVGETELFAPGALELLSAKVAGQSGDVRRALDLGRRVLEMSKTPSTRPSGNNGSTGPATPPRRDVAAMRRKSQRQLFAEPENTLERSPIKPRSLWDECNSTPKKSERTQNENIRRTPRLSLEGSPRKRKSDVENINSTPSKTPLKDRVLERTPLKYDESETRPRGLSVLNGNIGSPSKVRVSPRKVASLLQSPSRKVESAKTPVKQICSIENSPVRRSPRKRIVPPDVKSSPGFSIRAQDVLKVVNEVYGSARNLKTEESAFPLHQKLVVCSLMLILSKAKNRDVTVGKLHEVYSRVCTKRGITPVDQSGFIFLCRQVEMTGAVVIGKGPPRMAKVTLQWDQTEVAHALQDSSLLASIMSDTSCLSK